MKFALFVTLACAWGAYDVAARAAIQTDAGKVVGGEVATPGQFPYQVSLQDVFGSHFCGGSLIAPDLVITAAHCIQGQWDFLLWIVAGFNDLSNEGQAQSRRVAKMEYHGSFGQGLANDVAYIRLDNPFDLTDLVQTVKLPFAGLTPSLAAGDCTVSGWGATSISSSGQPSYPNEMHFGNIQGLSDEDCLALFDAMPNPPVGADVVPEANFCAYTPEGGLNACFGDSGGPLVCTANEDGERYLFGVVSWGPAPYCGEVGFPAVYTDVLGYLDWITSNTGVSV